MTQPTPEVVQEVDGYLRLEHSSHIRDKQAVVEPEDRPLYDLLMDVLADAHVPDLMPAHLAAACETLPGVREFVMSYDRGYVDAPGASYGMSFCHAVRDAIDEWRDREPIRLLAVGCSGSKAEPDEPVPAKELYDSTYWSLKRQYGESFGDDWRIISAEHGLLHPDHPIDYYECTPTDLRAVPVDSDVRLPSGTHVETLLDQWAVDVWEGLQQWLSVQAGSVDPRDVELEVLLGRSYREPLAERAVFDRLSHPGALSISFPFQDVERAQGGIGTQMGWMSDEIAAAREVAADGGESR